MRPKKLPELGLFKRRVAAFTLAEVTMCIAVTGIIFIGILAGYVQSTRHAERSELSLAVFGLASHQPEQSRAAGRETSDSSALNEGKQLPSIAWTNPDGPVSD